MRSYFFCAFALLFISLPVLSMPATAFSSEAVATITLDSDDIADAFDSLTDEQVAQALEESASLIETSVATAADQAADLSEIAYLPDLMRQIARDPSPKTVLLESLEDTSITQGKRTPKWLRPFAWLGKKTTLATMGASYALLSPTFFVHNLLIGLVKGDDLTAPNTKVFALAFGTGVIGEIYILSSIGLPVVGVTGGVALLSWFVTRSICKKNPDTNFCNQRLEIINYVSMKPARYGRKTGSWLHNLFGKIRGD